MDLLKILGKRIQNFREERKLTQEDMEEKTGINARYLSAIECGKRNVTLDTLDKIAKGLGIELYELLLPWEGGDSEQKIKRAFEKLINELKGEELRLCFDILRRIISIKR